MKKRVAIIGAGPCGLSQLRAFQQAQAKGADIPELVCFERQSDWGGLWHYTWRTGLDEYGEPVHCSMYRYLWTNGPKESLEFGDYSFEEHFGKPIPSFPPYAVLNDYILGRAEKSGVRGFVRFNTAVRQVTWSEESGRFTVRSTNLVDRRTTKRSSITSSSRSAISRSRTSRASRASTASPAGCCTATTSGTPWSSRASGCSSSAAAIPRRTSRCRTSSTARRRLPARTGPARWASSGRRGSRNSRW